MVAEFNVSEFVEDDADVISEEVEAVVVVEGDVDVTSGEVDDVVVAKDDRADN